MTRIFLLSDTHSYIDDRILHYAQEADQVWHAGDIGDFKVTESLDKLGTLKAVHGNIDDHKMRTAYPETQYFEVEGVKILMTHIAQYPGRYTPSIRALLANNPCDLFVSGHSHILKVMRDPKLGHMHLNPGAAGTHGFHKVRTALKFVIHNRNIDELQVIEFGERGRLKP